jgi:hypothetical protein
MRSMTRNTIFPRFGLVALGLCMNPAALAQAALDRATLKAELFGVELSGYEIASKTPWRECIAPDGTTLYTFAGEVTVGRLTISQTAQACFSYAPTFPGSACFSVSREAGGYRFAGGVEGTFVATRVRRGVTACRSEDVPVG